MKSFLLRITPVLLLFFSFSCMEPRWFTITTRFSSPVITRPDSPGAGHIWIEGEWFWNGRTYMWRDGYWSKPMMGYFWIPGEWRKRNHGWYWRPGHWKR